MISPSPRKVIRLKGLFVDGVWHCNCPKRMPAIKFQVKNHGQNHGRYFYRCQNQKCDFFLWASDAEPREKATVLSSSRSEPDPEKTQTPTKKPRLSHGLLTPQTEQRHSSHYQSPATGGGQQQQQQPHQLPKKYPQSAKARMMSEDIDEFEWDSDVGLEAGKLLLDTTKPPPPPIRQPDFGLPKRAPAPAAQLPVTKPTTTMTTSFSSSPVKRKWSDADDGLHDHNGDSLVASFALYSPRPHTDRVPSSTTVPPPPSGMEFSMTPTPTRFRNALAGPDAALETSQLAAQAGRVLERHRVALPAQAQEELTSLLDKFDLKMKGIIRGRDISRVALKKKDEEIEELKAQLARFEGRR